MKKIFSIAMLVFFLIVSAKVSASVVDVVDGFVKGCVWKNWGCLAYKLLPNNPDGNNQTYGLNGDSKDYHEWAPSQGHVYGYGNIIKMRIRFDNESLRTLNTKSFGQPFALEIDISEANNGSRLVFDFIRHTFPESASAIEDTSASNWINSNKNASGLLIRNAQAIKVDHDYYVYFHLKYQIPTDGILIVPSVQISYNTHYLQITGVMLADKELLLALKSPWNFFPLESEVYVDDTAKRSSWMIYPNAVGNNGNLISGMSWHGKRLGGAKKDFMLALNSNFESDALDSYQISSSGRYDKLDKVCQSIAPNPLVEQFRNPTTQRITIYKTPQDANGQRYVNMNCDIGAFALPSATDGDAAGSGSTGGTAKSSKPNLVAIDTFVTTGESASSTRLTPTAKTFLGTPIWCQMRTKNSGSANAPAFNSECVVSVGQKFDGWNDAKSLGYARTGSLAKAATNTEHKGIDILFYPNWYNVVSKIDPNNAIAETVETDNSFNKDNPFTFQMWGRPNIVASVSADKASYTLGETVSATASFANTGANPYGKTGYVDWYVDGTLLSEQDRILRENLHPGVSGKVEGVSFPAPQSYGEHEIKACFRYALDDLVEEVQPSDNCAVNTFSVPDPNPPVIIIAPEAPPPPPPAPTSLENLVGVSVDFGSEQVTEANEVFTPGFIVRNDGVAGTALITIGYYLDGTLVGTDQIQPGNLPTGDTKRETFEGFSVPTAGQHTFKACVDYLNTIVESNENDGCGSLTFNVQLPSGLVGMAVDFGGEQVIEASETFTPGLTVRNDGVVGNTLIKIGYYLDGTLVGTDQIQAANLLPGGTKRETLEKFSVPTEGPHTLKGCVDYANEISEANELDNCAEKVFQVVSIVYKPVDAPLVTSCPQMPEPDFNAVPTIPSEDVGATVFGNTKQKIFIPIATLPQARANLVWDKSFTGFDPALVTKWCWNSDETYWGANYSKACGTTFAEVGNNWVIEIPNTPQASKGTWSFIQGGTEYWVKPDTITALPLDTDGHIRYNNWTPNTVTVGDDPSGMMVTASFSNKNISGFWLPTGSVLNGKAYWVNDADPYPGALGRLECDVNTGKLKATIPNVAPSSTGRVILGLTDATQFVWQITPQWVLPVGATVTNADGDYKLPASVSTFQKREVLYDKGQQKLTITISGDDRMLKSFSGVTKLDQVTTEAYFDAWIVPTGQAVKLIKGDVARSVMGVWTLVFVGLPPDFGGSVYLPLTSGAKAWQDVSKFAFGSAIMVDTVAGNYVMPK